MKRELLHILTVVAILAAFVVITPALAEDPPDSTQATNLQGAVIETVTAYSHPPSDYCHHHPVQQWGGVLAIIDDNGDGTTTATVKVTFAVCLPVPYDIIVRTTTACGRDFVLETTTIEPGAAGLVPWERTVKFYTPPGPWQLTVSMQSEDSPWVASAVSAFLDSDPGKKKKKNRNKDTTNGRWSAQFDLWASPDWSKVKGASCADERTTE